jgi:hypothetical protein
MSKNQMTNNWLWILFGVWYFFGIWSLQFGIYLKFDACDLLFPVYPG